jgi:hypothetical protein
MSPRAMVGAVVGRADERQVDREDEDDHAHQQDHVRQPAVLTDGHQ